MKKKLHLIQKPLRLSCAWVATGDSRMPLKCAWRTADDPAALPHELKVNEQKSGRMHLCA